MATKTGVELQETPRGWESPLEQRFWAKVVKDGPLWNGTPCWLWQGAGDRTGHGQFFLRRRENGSQEWVYAHRFAYERLVGLIPDGLVVDHQCNNPPCVNPVHLKPMTNVENVMRGSSPLAKHARATHCPKGHPYDLVNTYFEPGGGRGCKTCRAESVRQQFIKNGGVQITAAHRKAQGLCVWCTAPVVNGKTKCHSCLAKDAARAREDRRKRVLV